MMRFLERTRRRLGQQDGITLVEMVVATAILGIVMLVFTSTLAVLQRAEVGEESRTRSGDQARLALQTIDKMVRSGNLLYNPASETGTVDPFGVSAPSYLFRVYTQAKLAADDDPKCAAWLVDDERQLLFRSWPAEQPSQATDWRVVATGVVNRDLSPAVLPFTLDSSARTVTVTFEINDELDRFPEATQRYSQSITGRNTAFGYPNDVCADLPSDM
jgi:prepilin-type N-terminal cleavage/methylation domain-containing protein